MKQIDICYIPEATRAHSGNHHFHCANRDTDVNQHFTSDNWQTEEHFFRSAEQVWFESSLSESKYRSNVPPDHILIPEESQSFVAYQHSDDVIIKGKLDKLTVYKDKLCLIEEKNTKKFKNHKQCMDSITQGYAYLKSWNADPKNKNAQIDTLAFVQRLKDRNYEADGQEGDIKVFYFTGEDLINISKEWEKRVEQVVRHPDLISLEMGGEIECVEAVPDVEDGVLPYHKRYRGFPNNCANYCIENHDKNCEYYLQNRINPQLFSLNQPAVREK